MNIQQILARLRSRRYSVADAPFSVPVNVGVPELSKLINGLLAHGRGDEEANHVDFEFLVGGEFLLMSLEEFMSAGSISYETVLEIEYVERQTAPEPQDSLVHDDWVSCLHARGDYIVSGCYDNTLHIWTRKGDHRLVIPGHSAPVKCVSWIKTDDSHMFVSGSHDETLLLWRWHPETNAVDCLQSCKGHARSVDCVALDPTQTKFCSGSWDNMLKIWAIAGSRDAEECDDQSSRKKKKTEEAKVPTKVPILTLSGHNGGLSNVEWPVENEIFTSSWDHSIKIWDVSHAVEKHTMTGPKVFLDMSYCKQTGLLITGSADRHVRLWDPRMKDGQIVRGSFTSHTGWVSGVKWSPVNDQQFISGSYDTLLKLWDIRSPSAPLYDMSGHSDKILAVDWSNADQMLSGGADNSIKMFTYSDYTRTEPMDSQ